MQLNISIENWNQSGTDPCNLSIEQSNLMDNSAVFSFYLFSGYTRI